MSENDFNSKMSLISGSTNLESISDADIVIEAVFEEMTLKKKCLQKLISYKRKFYFSN